MPFPALVRNGEIMQIIENLWQLWYTKIYENKKWLYSADFSFRFDYCVGVYMRSGV